MNKEFFLYIVFVSLFCTFPCSGMRRSTRATARLLRTKKNHNLVKYFTETIGVSNKPVSKKPKVSRRPKKHSE